MDKCCCFLDELVDALRNLGNKVNEEEQEENKYDFENLDANFKHKYLTQEYKKCLVEKSEIEEKINGLVVELEICDRLCAESDELIKELADLEILLAQIEDREEVLEKMMEELC